MADTTYSGVWTKTGLEKLAEFASSGDGITLTHIALGDGNGSTPLPSESVTALANEIWRGTVTSVSKNEDESSVAVEIVVPYDVGGFFIREWGIFDTDGDLIAYGNHADFYKALLAEGTGAELREIIELPVSSDGQITIQVSYESLATVAYVGQEVEGLEEKIDAVQEEIEEKLDTLETQFETDLEEHNTDPDAHSNLAVPSASTEIEGKVFTATDEDIENGTNTNKYVTPKQLNDTLGSVEAFPTGTRMLFQQAAAPTGWVKDTTATYNDSALRIVTGTPTTGGSVAFSTAFASKTISVAGSIANTTVGGTVGATTLAAATIPSHKHNMGVRVGTSISGTLLYGYVTVASAEVVAGLGSANTVMPYTSPIGSSGSHTHSLTTTAHSHTFTGTNTSVNLAVKYTDFIICTKS